MKFANDKAERNLGIVIIAIFVFWISSVILGLFVGGVDVADDVEDAGISIGDKYYSADELRKAREYSYDYVSGKPVDMSDQDWEYANRRLLSEGMKVRHDRHEAVRALWRQERYIRKQLE